MQRVMVNLLRNGIDAMESVQDYPKLLILRAEHDKTDIVVEVAGNGIG
jgi:C4-dicarboxylate-specific signal transduction histidine kinase